MYPPLTEAVTRFQLTVKASPVRLSTGAGALGVSLPAKNLALVRLEAPASLQQRTTAECLPEAARVTGTETSVPGAPLATVWLTPSTQRV